MTNNPFFFEGWIVDATKNYSYAFYFAGVPPLVGSAIMFFIPSVGQRESGTQAEAFASISHWSLYDASVHHRTRGKINSFFIDARERRNGIRSSTNIQ